MPTKAGYKDMNIIENFLTKNDCYKAGVKFTPRGIMVHSTAVPGAMAKNFLSSWNKSFKDGETDIQACVHFFIDDTGIYQTLPLDIRSWHAGSPANDMFLSFEICEPADYNDAVYFAKVWKNAVDLCVWLTQKYNFDTDMIICHCEGYQKGWATNHADVMHWFPIQNKNMDMFRDEVWGAIHNPKEVIVLNFEQALQVLVDKKIINSPDRWKMVGEVVTYFKEFVINVANYVSK